MRLVGKGFEALGIACVMIGLVQGIQGESMWMELYLSIFGIVIFLLGYGVEKWLFRKSRLEEKPPERR